MTMTYQPGDILLDKYRIEAPLGQGAFGEVYRVTHLALTVQRALKILRHDAPGMGSSAYADGQARFLLEAQLGAQLNSQSPHPHLLQIYNFEASTDLLVLEMEYAPGGSLAERLEQARKAASARPIATADALRVAVELASGLAALHARQIVHRDLKPGNVLFDHAGRAKVADLGLAQVPGGPSMRSKLSEQQSQPHPGTPEYMSPEQEREFGILRPPSDVYALGLVLFEMLTLQKYSLLKPGTKASKYNPVIPPALDDLLVRLLSKSPEERPWDGEESGQALREFMDGGNAEAREREKKAQEAREALEKATEIQRQQDLARKKQEAERLAKEKAAEIQRQQEVVREKQEAERRRALVLELAPGVEMEFVRVPAGEFLMGSDENQDNQANKDELPQHKVSLDEYLIGTAPVTNRQYQIFVQKAGHRAPEHWRNGQIPAGKEDHPVVYVSWDDAAAFCKWVGQVTRQAVRLPSEAEWEKAARGLDGRIYPWGNQKPDANLCNFNGNMGDTTPVGKYSPRGDSPYGCVDMAGNIWEWCADWYDKTYYQDSPASNPTGPASGAVRVLRGGSWVDYDSLVRSAFRDWDYPTFTDDDLGFRCVRSN